MRKRFEQQPELDFCPIPEVKINTKNRHQLSPLLVGLQYIFSTPQISEQIFKLLEDKVTNQKKKTGRMGMSLWEILVLGVVRLNLDIDYDFLMDQANNHSELRGILGVQTNGVFGTAKKVYKLQTIIDNVYLIDEETIAKINEILVKSGHDILKKKEGKEVLDLILKSDSYAVESNIHFPTDINLSWDSVRKTLDTIKKIEDEEKGLISGWRKRNAWRGKVKSKNRNASNIHSKKGANYQERLERSTKTLLALYDQIIEKVELSLIESKTSTSIKVMVYREQLKTYNEYLKKFSDQLKRRILEGEKIPHSEKVFSIFEPQVEWLQKGKQNNKVELGHNVLVTTDQNNLILDYKVMVDQRDNSQPLALLERLEQNYKIGYNLKSISFDRGFYSKLSKEGLEKVFTTVVMPNKGRQSKDTIQRVEDKDYKRLMKSHSAVESNINELEHSGVNKVPDKGLVGFVRYVGYGVLAYNLKRLGKIILEHQEQETKKHRSRKKVAA